jgi:hypothetical protein
VQNRVFAADRILQQAGRGKRLCVLEDIHVCALSLSLSLTHTHTHSLSLSLSLSLYFCLLTLNCNYIPHSVHIPYHTSYPTFVQYLLLQLLVMGKFVNNKLERTKTEVAVACYGVLWAVFTWT